MGSTSRRFAPRDADVVYQPPLRWVSVNLDTVNGYYEASWELTDDGFDVRLLVPPGCSARLIMPDGSEHEVGSGAHELSLAFAEPGDGIPVLREVSEALQ